MQTQDKSSLEIVPVDYEAETTPESVRCFRPTVYRDGNSLCCLLGPDPQEGIFGCGPDMNATLKDWDRHLHDRINNHAESDDFADELVAMIGENQWSIGTTGEGNS
jgi:hypothetical protein